MEPIDQNAVVGHGVSIACQAEGFPIPTVTWKQSIGKSRLRLETYQPTVAGGSSRSEKLSSVLLETTERDIRSASISNDDAISHLTELFSYLYLSLLLPLLFLSNLPYPSFIMY